ncbi:energy transducer TonB [Xenorhabdus sp. PB62.4]|uniref:energy transducer TonB n=1 Tax=Xenorhabdus sp. PB62.4 TaxID=1851573 RepID=UPI0016574406|nr:energy transducer TonB [Xenorhabdus sp. PB62.4]MBC8953035.1 TonB-like protein [Xenorhabdus sp. PB62.4]
MTNAAILDNSVANSSLILGKRFLTGILIAILVHTSLIWLLNRHASYDDTAHHINNNASMTELSITMVAAPSQENKPEPVSLPFPLLTAPESPAKPAIVLDKAVHPENKVEKPKKRQKQQKEKPQEVAETKPVQSPQVQKNSHTEQQTNGSDQIHSEGSISRATTSQPLVGQGNSAVDNYQARLRQEIERYKDYPRKAKRMKQEGAVMINFTLLDDGTLSAASVVSSSGNSTLDNAALNAVNRASSVGPRPVGMEPDVTLTLDFALR